MDEQSIFLQALEQPEGEARDQWLDKACDRDPALRSRIDNLLKQDAQKGSFLENPPSSLEPTVFHDPLRGLAASAKAKREANTTEDASLAVGSVVQGVLRSLGMEVDIPQVSLREENGVDPILRTRSLEIPKDTVGNRYQLLGEIARGGMGAVIKGRDIDLGRDLAIKVLLDTHKERPEVIRRFIEEAQIGGQLQHPGIAPIYELGQFADNRPFFAMKLVKGQTLSKLLSERRDPTDDRSRFLSIFEQVCQTMAYAHSRGVIHRDLKPANIMVGAFGEVQVMDWGLAKVMIDGGVNDEKRALKIQNGTSIIETLRSGIGSDAPGTFGNAGSHTKVGVVMGTPAYMPPEQALGEIHHVDERADVFALGAILCEILTGMPPYVTEDGTQIFRMAVRGKLEDCFARLASCNADDELIALTKDCLELEPIARPRDASAVAKRMRDYLESVETRLRDAEKQRAAQEARAEAEAIRLVQQQQATRKLRKMLSGLAVVASIAIGTSAIAVWFWQKATLARNQALASELVALNNSRRADENALNAEEQAVHAQRAERETAFARDLADQKAELASQNLYFAQMRLAQKSFYDYRSVQRMRDLLHNWIPQTGDKDRRGWEWFYLNSLSYRNVRTLTSKEPNNQPYTLAWHTKSNRLAEGNVSGRIRIWDLDREQPILELKTPNARDTYWGRRWINWSPEGDKLAAGFDDHSVYIWDSRTGEELHVLQGLTSSVISVAFSNDGTRIAACSRDGQIGFWSVDTGHLNSTILHPDGVTNGAWSSDNRSYATGHGSGELFLSDVTTGNRIANWQAQPSWFHELEWSPDNTRIATTGMEGSDRFALRVWDVATQQLLFEPRRHNHGITSLAWEPTGRRIATGTMAEEIRIWDADTGMEINSLRGHTESVTSLSWGPGDSLASAATDGEIKIWTSLQSQPVTKLSGNVPLRSVRWSPNGKLLASADDNGRISVRDATSGNEQFSVQAHERRILSKVGFLEFDVSLAWSPDGNHLASGGLDGELRIWEAESGEEVFRLSKDLDRIWCVDWSSDGSFIALGSEDGCIRIIEAFKPDSPMQVIMAHSPGTFGVTGVAWSPDGNRIASCGNDKLVKVWDAKDRAELSSMQGHGGWIFDVDWRADGKQLASSGADGNVIIWDVATGAKQMALRSGQEFVMAVAWNPEGTRLASAPLSSDIQIWDPVSGEECSSLHVPYVRFHDVSWCSDGARIAAASNMGELCVWDATRGFEQDATSRALPYIDRAFASGNVSGIDRISYAKTYLREGKRAAATDALKEDVRGLMQLAQVFQELGEIEAANSTRRQARTLAEKELTIDPSSRTAADALVELLLHEVDAKIGSATPTRPSDGSSRTISSTNDRWGTIAVAYKLLGEELSLTRVLRDHPKAALAIADLDASMKNWNAAIEVYSQWITREPSDTDLLEKRASAYIAIDQWEQALGDLQRVVATNPERTESVYERVRQTERWQEVLPFGRMLIANQPGAEPELVWLRVAPVAALAGEAPYREFCQQMLPLFQNTQDPLVADRFIKACLLRPGCVDTQSLPIGTLARSLDENTLADWAKPWLWTTRALFAYRSGDPQSTLAYAEQSESMNPAPSIHGLNLALVALAEHELRHEEKSERLLGELSQMISEQKTTSGTLSHDFLIIEVLYREIRAKMEKP